MEVRPGYKLTEVGVIPEEWTVRALGTLTTLVASGRSSTNSHTGNFPVHGSTGVIAFSEKPDYEGNALLVARVGANAGRLNFVSGQYGVSDNTIILCLSKACDLTFIWRQLEAIRLNKLVFGSGQPLITGTQLKSLPLAMPLLQEQRVIAEVLSDADELLTSLDQLITKKRDIKQAAMQQLLSGKVRLPGYHNSCWYTLPLGELIQDCFSGATPRRNNPGNFKGNIRWITSGELNYNVITDTIEKITEEAVNRANLKILPKGTFLMAITGLEAEGTRGSCGIVGEPATTNQSCMAIFPNSRLKTEFLFHYYVYKGKPLAVQYCQGTKQQSYTAKLVRRLPITFPTDLKEQATIATLLTEMDMELNILVKRRDKAQLLKQAMMQELLTGRIRLV